MAQPAVADLLGRPARLAPRGHVPLDICGTPGYLPATFPTPRKAGERSVEG